MNTSPLLEVPNLPHHFAPPSSFPRSRFNREILPPARQFYESELGKLSRPSRGWAMGNCPFHESKSHRSFSVQLDSGGFFCHGCGAKGGDLLDFIRLRYKLDFKSAAQYFGAWLYGDEAEQLVMAEAAAKRKREGERAAQAKIEGRRRRLDVRDHLHAIETLYRESCDEQNWDLMVMFHDRQREVEATYLQLSGLEK